MPSCLAPAATYQIIFANNNHTRLPEVGYVSQNILSETFHSNGIVIFTGPVLFFWYPVTGLEVLKSNACVILFI